jgi:hypothetical protein
MSYGSKNHFPDEVNAANGPDPTTEEMGIDPDYEAWLASLPQGRLPEPEDLPEPSGSWFHPDTPAA